MKRTFLFVVLYWVVLNSYGQCHCGGSFSSVAFSDISNASVTLRKKQWVIELSGDYRKFKAQHGAHSHNSHEHVHSGFNNSESSLKSTFIGLAGIHYGITKRLTLSLQQPYLVIQATPKGTNGIGDLLFVANIKLVEKTNLSAGIMLGTELPTGIASGLAGENNSVIGSGSFDPVFGIGILKNWPKSFMRFNIFYKYGTIGYNKTNFGSFLNQNLTFSYKIKGSNLVCSPDSTKLNKYSNKYSLSIFTSISNEWYGHQISDHAINQNSGGYLILAGLGTQLGIGTWHIPLSFNVPVLQDFNGEQNKTEFRFKTGIIKTFN